MKKATVNEMHDQKLKISISSKNLIEKIRQFEIELEDVSSTNSNREQQAIMESVYAKIFMFLKSDLRNAKGGSNIIEITLGGFKLIEAYLLTYEFIKDPRLDFDSRRQKIFDVKKRIEAELKVLEKYIIEGVLVRKTPL